MPNRNKFYQYLIDTIAAIIRHSIDADDCSNTVAASVNIVKMSRPYRISQITAITIIQQQQMIIFDNTAGVAHWWAFN